MILVAAAAVFIVVIPLPPEDSAGLTRRLRTIRSLTSRRHFRRGLLDDLVEFAAVEPYAPALGTVVNFHRLALHHEQIYGTYGTLHQNDLSFPYCGFDCRDVPPHK